MCTLAVVNARGLKRLPMRIFLVFPETEEPELATCVISSPLGIEILRWSSQHDGKARIRSSTSSPSKGLVDGTSDAWFVICLVAYLHRNI